jgi:hypothetical protein
MPIHDWSRVSDRTFHHFHIFWFSHLSDALNEGLLPPGYYALVEPVVGEAIPDVLTLEAQAGGAAEATSAASPRSEEAAAGSLALLDPPAVIQELGPSYAELARHLLVRSEVEGDRVVAAIELVSRRSKVGRAKVDQFVSMSLGYLESGIHLAILDVQAPTNLVRGRFHALICEATGQDPPEARSQSCRSSSCPTGSSACRSRRHIPRPTGAWRGSSGRHSRRRRSRAPTQAAAAGVSSPRARHDLTQVRPRHSARRG